MNAALPLPRFDLAWRAPARATAHPWLDAGEVRRCQSRQARRLQVVSGRAWITVAGSPDDHFLGPGHSLALEAGADLLVQADGAEPLRWRWLPPDTTTAATRGAAR